MMSILIPSRKDPHLQATIDDIRKHAKGEIEIIVVLDGGGDTPTGADKVLVNRRHVGLRGAVNQAVRAAKGEWLMKIDAHCMFDDGFDVKLLEEIEEDWVVTPVRYRLDVDKWEICADEPSPIIYERLVIDQPDKIGGVEWKSRKRGREKLLIDENMVFQGSCWLMSRKHWEMLGGLSEEGYGTFTQEPVEIALKTWLGGGKVMVNKKTWYAHKHRKYRRTYSSLGEEVKKGNEYSRDYWLNNRWAQRKHDISWLMERFGA
jgi:glycosyltransferase involved in cell wall biosynthesis